MIKKILFVLLSIVYTTTVWSQIVEDPTRWKHEVKHLDGDNYEVITTCTFADKDWHLYAFDPGGDGTLIAPELGYSFDNGATKVGKTTEHGKRITQNIKGVGKVNFLKGPIRYKQKFKATKDGTVKGTVYYQTCNEEMCLPPTEIEYSVKYKVAKTKDKTEKDEDVNTPDEDTAKTSPVLLENVADSSATDTVDTTEQDTGLGATMGSDDGSDTSEEDPSKKKESNLSLLLKGILAGLFSIVTPCVFAMLPMVVSLFLKRSKTKQEGVKVATQYTLSIVAIFAIFGLILTLFVRDGDVLHRFSTHWVTNVALFILFLVFALSFLWAFDNTLTSIMSTANDKRANTNNFVGVFFMALTLVIVSFSCTLPFLGGLAASITNGTGWAPFWGFLGFGIGLGLPFTLFVMFPSWLSAINKQGGWLNTLKVSLGFIELAMAFKFLSNADLVKGWRLLDREVFIAIWVTIAVVWGLYLLGSYSLPKDSKKPENLWGQSYISVSRLLFAIAAFTFGAYLFPGMWGAPLNGMGAFIPPMGTFDAFGGVAAMPAHESDPNLKYAENLKIYEPEAVAKYDLEVVFDYQQALQMSREQDKPIMIDFTGIACANCRKMESSVWSDPLVGQLLHDHFIIASLFTDAYNEKLKPEDVYTNAKGKEIKNLGEKNVDIQISKYESNTQPYYFFIDADENRLVAEGYGYSPTNANPTRFAEVLQEAIQKYQNK